jgi:hypothetical protein
MASIDNILLVLAIFLETVLAGVLLKRRLHREFRFFFSYVAVGTLADSVKLVVIHDYRLYFQVFWTAEALIVFLALAALYESYFRVFRNFFRVHPWFWRIFPAAVVIVVVISAVYAVTRPPIKAIRITSLIVSLEIGVNLIQFSIFLLFRGAMIVFHARRRNYPLGIVNGFAVLAAAGIAYTLVSEFGTKLIFLVHYGVPVAYILADVVWLDTFLRPPEAAPQLPAGMTLEQALAEMAQGTKELKDLSRRLKDDR